MEDEELVRVTCKRSLEIIGYKTIAPASPEEALQSFKLHPDSIDMLLTDIIMPGMDGRELAKQIRMIRPNIKVLFMSGYTAKPIVGQELMEQKTAFIAKPFTRDELATKLCDLLHI